MQLDRGNRVARVDRVAHGDGDGDGDGCVRVRQALPWFKAGGRGADQTVVPRMPKTRGDQSHATFAVVLSSAQLGEEWAFRSLYEAHGRPVTAFVRARVGADADEIVNETFVGVFTGLARFEGGEADFRAWIFQIARNKINDHHRRGYRRVEQVPLGSDHDLDRQRRDPTFELGDHSGELEAMLRILTPDQHEVILLRVLADLSIEQVAEILDRPPGAIKSLQHRALETMRRHLSVDGVSR